MQLKFFYFLWSIAKHWYQIKSWFLTVFGDIRFSVWPLWLMYQPNDYQIKGKHIYNILSLIKPGDIILRGYDKKFLDGLFIPSKHGVSHAGVYVGDNKVIHAVAQGISQIHLIDYCQADKLYVVRPKNGNVAKAIQLAHKYLGTPYDFSFKSGDQALYCFQLAVHCYPDIYFPKCSLSLFGIPLPRAVGECYLDRSFLQNDKCQIITMEPK